MLIYAAADLHGRPERLAAIETHVATQRPDLLVLAGDLSRRMRPDEVAGSLSRLSLPTFFIRGNSDSRRLEASLGRPPRLQNLHATRKIVNEVGFVGVGGTLPLPFHSRLGLAESALVARLSDLLQPGDVLVAHPPPYGVRDRVLGRFHAGSRAVKRLVERRAPALVICGHIHEQAGIETLGKTVVVNCAMGRSCNGVLIRYDGESVPECAILP
ncbi:metallophosphoesterase [Desulfosarcina widdelii]|uniref:Metallophosphoesterase n=1 Tax=Desulfosarcina widdelii TaxID=947919 RepID=A0A5K7ZB10_9BACT|nr:metallophosphoesterase [Desulfosarcina widdelii]BBO78278.1 metallophosphoesterase [Desulfosarcina widdelii]